MGQFQDRAVTIGAEIHDMGLAADAQVDALSKIIHSQESRIEQLTKELEECRNPTTPVGTLMGVTVNGAVRKSMPDLHNKVSVSRVFAQGTKVWSQETMHKVFPNGKWAVSNSYALAEKDLPAFLASIPDEDKDKIVGYADGHELEHPDKNLNPADVKARMRRTAQVIRDAGLSVASCVMGFSIKDDEWLRWIDPEVVDLIAFDKYNSGNKKTPPIYQDPALVVAPAAAQGKRFGKPVAFWETGTNNFGTVTARVNWAKQLRAEMVKENFVTGIWFDRTSTSGSGWDASLDRPTAEAWLL